MVPTRTEIPHTSNARQPLPKVPGSIGPVPLVRDRGGAAAADVGCLVYPPGGEEQGLAGTNLGHKGRTPLRSIVAIVRVRIAVVQLFTIATAQPDGGAPGAIAGHPLSCIDIVDSQCPST